MIDFPGVIAPTPIVQIVARNIWSQTRNDAETLPNSSEMWRYFFGTEPQTRDLPRQGMPTFKPSLYDHKKFKLQFGIALPREMVFFYAIRPDLQQLFDIKTDTGAARFVIWWLISGASEFGDLGKDVNRSLMNDLHWRHLPKMISAGKAMLTPMLSLIWEERPELRAEFDIGTTQGTSSMWEWWMNVGKHEYPDATSTGSLEESILAEIDNQPAKILSSDQVLPAELLFLYMIRPDLQKLYDIKTATGVAGFLMWWMATGAMAYGKLGPAITFPLMQDLHWRYLPDMIASGSASLTPLLSLIWRDRIELRSEFSIDTAAGVSSMWQWWTDTGVLQYPAAAATGSLELMILNEFEEQKTRVRPPGQLLPNELLFLHAIRPDLQRLFDIETKQGVAAFLTWWLATGATSYADLGPAMTAQLMQDLHWRHLPVMIASGHAKLTPAMSAVWQSRPELRSELDISTPQGVSAMWQWWTDIGALEYPDAAATGSLENAIFAVIAQRPAEAISFDHLLPSELAFLHSIRPDVQQLFDIKTVAGAAGFLMWWFTSGAAGFGSVAQKLSASLMQDLHWNHLSEMIETGVPKLTPLLSAVWQNRPELHSQFDIDTAAGISAIWQWWSNFGATQYPAAAATGSLESAIMAEIEKRPITAARSDRWLPKELLFLYAIRPDLHQLFDIKTEAGATIFLMWWFKTGAAGYGVLGQTISSALMHELHWRCLPAVIASGKAPATPFLSAVWQSRSELHAQFDLTTTNGTALMWQWWTNVGILEYPAAAATGSLENVDIAGPGKRHSAPEAIAGKILPNELAFVYATRPDLQRTFDIETEDGAAGFLMWWLTFGASGAGDLGKKINAILMEDMHWSHLPKMIASGTIQITPFMHLLWRGRADLRSHFDIATSSGISWLWRWWIDAGVSDYPEIASTGSLNDVVPARSNNKRQVFELSSGQHLPNELLFIYAIRPDLHLAFDIKTRTGTFDFLMWWFAEGASQFGRLGQHIDRVVMWELHGRDLQDMISCGRFSLTSLLGMILQNRSDLRSLFDTRHEHGVFTIWIWWTLSGIPELRANAGACSGKSHVSEFPKRVSTDVRTQQSALPDIMWIIYLARDDLQKHFDLTTADGRGYFICWWLAYGRIEFPSLRDSIDQCLVKMMHLDHLPASVPLAGLEPTPLIQLTFLYRQMLGLPDRIQTHSSVDLWRWWIQEAQSMLFADKAFSIADGETLIRLAELAALFPIDAPADQFALAHDKIANVADPEVTIQPAAGHGICLVGYPRGEFGLGEDIRLLRAALQSMGIDPTIIRASWQIAARQNISETSVDADLASFDGDVLVYVMPAFDTVTLLNKVGPRAFAAKRKIGFWQWELSHFPHSALLAMDLVDEIWCHSEHAAQAFRAATKKPVIKVPLPVFVPEPRHVSRAAFGLSDNAFVVFTSFDGSSAIARKNPLATILAFQQAFADGHKEVRLVLKAMNTGNDSLWRECLRRAAVDSRIVILDDVMDRDVYYQLLRNCDAVLSMHRAEGFGRLMAEAMALGIPVIASRYSGNLDFMTDENSWLVDGDLIPVLPGDYAFHNKQVWLEPNVGAAAQALRECANDDTDRVKRAGNGKADISLKYNLQTCGKAYVELLDVVPETKQSLTA